MPMSHDENATRRLSLQGIPFKKGTENHGLLYEPQVMTFIAAKLANDDTVSEFEMITNPDGVNCFEDILLKVKYKNGEPTMHVIQIKHSKNRLLIAKKKINKSKCLTIELSKYVSSFKKIHKIVKGTSEGPLEEFLRSVKFENYYFCLLTTIKEPDEDTKLNEINITSIKNLELVDMGNVKKCYQLDRKAYNSVCSEEFSGNFFIFLNQPDYSEITAQLTEFSDIIKHFTQPMANDLFGLITEHSFDSKENICKILNKEKFIQLCVQVILCNNMSIYMIRTKPIDERYMETWHQICFKHRVVSIDQDRTDTLLPLLASYYEFRIRKYTEIALENVLRGVKNSIEGKISLENHQFTWNDRQQNGFQLGYCLREALKTMGINAHNLRDLLPELWRRNEIPIIVETPMAHIIMDLVGSNTKNHFFIVSNGLTPLEGGVNAPKTFRNLMNLKDEPGFLDKIMEIELSLQGRVPVPLNDIVRNNRRTLELISSSDLLSWIGSDSQERKIGLPLKENIENYITRKFVIPSKNEEITEVDIVKDLKSSKLTIISNDPGMGKSTVLTSLARRCDPTRYTIICDLAQCKIDLQDSTTAIHINPIRYFYNRTQDEENPLVKGILQQNVDEKNLIILLDSFDEILPLHQDTVLNVVDAILVKGAHVFITSRTQAERLLLSRFGSAISNYVNLAYLENNDISDYFERCNVPKDMWAKLSESFLSTPLHLQMLHEIYRTGSKDSVKHGDETSLYRTFMDRKISIFYQKKNIYEYNTQDTCSPLVDDILNNHYIIALISLFGLERIQELKMVTNDEWDEMVCTFEEHKLALGIVSTINPIKFIHKTFAEYLAAVYINSKPDTTIQLYKDVVTSNDLYQTYKFLHEMRLLNVDGESIEAFIIHGHKKKVFDVISTSHSWNKVDKTWGMYAIHWAAVCCFMAIKSRTTDSKCFDILNIVVQATESTPFGLDIKDAHIGWNWLNYLTGHNTNSYNFHKNLILYSQTITNLNPYLKERMEEKVELKFGERENDTDWYSLGHLAVRNSDKVVIDYLLNNTSDYYYLGKDNYGRNILHHACMIGNLEIVDSIIGSKFGRNFINFANAHDNKGWTPLHYACHKGNQKLVEHLLQCGFTNVLNSGPPSPLHVACDIRDINLINYLIEQNADVNATQDFERNDVELTLFQEMCLTGNVDVFNVLLKEERCNHYAITRSNTLGNTTLHFAAMGGNIKILEALINKGLETDIKNFKQQTPFHYACSRGRNKAVLLLLDKGANPASVDNDGQSSLHFACEGGNSSIVDLLLDRTKIDVHIRDNFGRTPLHIAAQYNNVDVVTNLLERGASPNVVDNESESPLHAAYQSGHLDSVKLLMEGNADPEQNNSYDELSKFFQQKVTKKKKTFLKLPLFNKK